MHQLKKYIIWTSLGIDLVIADVLTKWLAERYIGSGANSGGGSLELISGVLQLKLSYNTGVAFSIPIPNLVMVFLAPLLLALLIIILIRSYNLEHRLAKIALMLVVAGGVGNLVSRLARGAVIDFIDFSFWPSFNLADAYLTIGVFLMIAFYGKINKENHGAI